MGPRLPVSAVRALRFPDYEAGKLTTIYSFPFATYPFARLIAASDGNFFGVSGEGGSCSVFSSGCGTIFQLTTAGVFTSLITSARRPELGRGPTLLTQTFLHAQSIGKRRLP